MNNLKFKIIEKCYQNPKNLLDSDIDFYLEENDWNDYNYYTTYYLHAGKRLTKTGELEPLGSLRIMRKGQSIHDSFELRKEFSHNGHIFTELPGDFVSLTFSIEIFQGLNRLLDVEKRKEFVQSMHLILGNDSSYLKILDDDDECFNKSLLRGGASLDSSELKMAQRLLFDEASYYDLRKQKLDVKFAHVNGNVSLDFSCVDELSSDLLPNGMAVFIGKNGSGKSTAIYKLAKLLYTNPTERFNLEESVGKLEINNIGVNKLFIVSYSPFDNFVMPGVTNSDYHLMFSKDSVKDQRFVFCGIRDLKLEYEKLQEQGKFNDDKENYIYVDRQENTFLKTIEQLASEFQDALNVIFEDYDRSERWKDLHKHCETFHMALYFDMKFTLEENLEECIEQFKSLSTGHKFFLHTMSHLIAYIDENSLVLFDEPENHLHPPLLSFMMAELRVILSKYTSVMFIATHSPVILQETFAKNVYVVRKDGDNVTIKHPRIETYGENFGSIMTEVFDLTTDVIKFYDAFDYLYDKWSMNEEPNIESMLNSFKDKIGHEPSSQMESYLINLYKGGPSDVETK